MSLLLGYASWCHPEEGSWSQCASHRWLPPLVNAPVQLHSHLKKIAFSSAKVTVETAHETSRVLGGHGDRLRWASPASAGMCVTVILLLLADAL